MSLQLEKRAVEFRGKQYEIVFNNEALDALETEYGGAGGVIQEVAICASEEEADAWCQAVFPQAQGG